jgi:hypothetical protein
MGTNIIQMQHCTSSLQLYLGYINTQKPEENNGQQVAALASCVQQQAYTHLLLAAKSSEQGVPSAKSAGSTILS